MECNYIAQKGPSHPLRTLRSLEGKWQDIKEQVSKFESHYTSVLNEKRSGFTDGDKITTAVNLYNSVESRPLTTLHCWEMLRTEEPKWVDLQAKLGQEHSQGGMGEPIDLTDSGPVEQGSASQTRPLKRPVGRDASKSAKQGGSSNSGSEASVEYTQQMTELQLEKVGWWKHTDGLVVDKIDRLISTHGESSLHMHRLEEEKLQLMRTLEKEKMRLKHERELEKIKLKQKKIDMEKAKEDERIMAIDLATCNPAQRSVFKAMQRELVLRWASKNV
ncbi:hypothetical protein BAE44_0025747 [Dichanthelium oligosanthes]|uniref:Uncharacterized protein n=1 Tax=Dichanthelium oligosanthes TaxID=888268 RepID=A0A1E5UK33_9POAL|nr:hypothetical protein BAE44_0025747 [Dichanthelium oligosanthes]